MVPSKREGWIRVQPFDLSPQPPKMLFAAFRNPPHQQITRQNGSSFRALRGTSICITLIEHDHA
jgi:hypothetical protein